MPSNYPPGVTGNEPEIAGESHHPECYANENYTHSKERRDHPNAVYPLYPLFGTRGGYWVLLANEREVDITFCPYCGEELPEPDCICKDLVEPDQEAHDA